MKKDNNLVYIHIRKSDNLPFYIGIGDRKRSIRKDNRTLHWKRVVAKHGYEVLIIANNLSRDSACRIEIALIKRYRDLNYPLVNVTSGGDEGFQHSEEARVRMGLHAIKKEKIHFWHPRHGEHYFTRKEIRDSYGLSRASVSRLISGALKSSKGWCLFTNKGFKFSLGRVFKFKSKDGHITEFLNQSQFRELYPILKSTQVSQLCLGKREEYLGWSIEDITY